MRTTTETKMAAEGAALHIVMHAFGKITLFFVAGAIYVQAHITKISQLDGQGPEMKMVFAAFFIGAMSIIGIPPLGGSWSKFYLMVGAADAGMVDEFGAHHARFAGHDEPRALGGHTVGCSVADEVHLGVVTADFDAGSRLDVHSVPEAFLPTAQPATASGAAVVAVHQHDVPLRVHQQGSKGAPRAIGGFGEGKALLDADGQVLVLHALTVQHESASAFQSFATMERASSSSAPRA